MAKPVYRTVWGQTPKYAAKQFAKSYETSRSIGVPEGDRHLVYVQQTPEDTARVGAELENMGYTVVYIDVFDEDVARGIWITADKKPRASYGDYTTPGDDPSMPGGGPPVYHGPEERYGGRRDVRVRGHQKRVK